MRSFEKSRKMEKKMPVYENGSAVLAFPECQIPEYQTAHSAGADFFCAEEVTIPTIWRKIMKIISEKGIGHMLKEFSEDEKDKYGIKPTLVHTGIKSSMEPDEVLELYNRSSNPKKLGLILANGVGVVDADYYENVDNDGEIMFAFYNIFPWDVTIKIGERIGQGVFKKYLRPTVGLRIKNVERTSGFGSTDKTKK